MGDIRRHETFTRFINKTFPRVKEVLIIADGKAQIARKLADRGIRVRVIEADSRYAGQPHPLITYAEAHGKFFEHSIRVLHDAPNDLHIEDTVSLRKPDTVC